MDKHEKKHLEQQNRLTLISIVVGIGIFCITNYITVSMAVRQEREEQKKTFKEALVKEKLDTYKMACIAAGRIIGFSGADSDSLHQSINKFEQLYWGEMAFIEDDSVGLSAKKFRGAYRDYLDGKRGPDERDKLKRAAVIFTRTCKAGAENCWDKLIKE